MFVWKNVGQRTVTLTSVPTSSALRVLERAMTPALATLYAPIIGPFRRPAAEATLRMWPCPCERKSGTKA